jgi:hypothetical protein
MRHHPPPLCSSAAVTQSLQHCSAYLNSALPLSPSRSDTRWGHHRARLRARPVLRLSLSGGAATRNCLSQIGARSPRLCGLTLTIWDHYRRYRRYRQLQRYGVHEKGGSHHQMSHSVIGRTSTGRCCQVESGPMH